MLTVGELFAGIGGIGLGLERTGGFEVRWQVEQSEFCRKVLAKHWPDVKRYGRVEDVGAHNLEPVDLICGGFPCQDVSAAGPRVGIEGERSGLWSEFARVLGEVGPRFVLVENVPGLLARGMGTVLGDLSEVGYDAEWDVVSACEFGAPHTRERVFIVAYPADLGPRQLRWEQCAEGSKAPWDICRTPLEPPVERVADGVPARVDRLRALGNAVVPQVAQWLGERILEAARVTPAVPERTREEGE